MVLAWVRPCHGITQATLHLSIFGPSWKAGAQGGVEYAVRYVCAWEVIHASLHVIVASDGLHVAPQHA